jgi:uncharacterized protein YndB with AHSA1/START domain
MKALKIVGIVLLALVVGIYGGSFLAPSEYGMERSITIDAPAAVVFEQIEDYKLWPAWSPWSSEDPDMKVIYSEQTKGVGAWYSWEGPKTGIGKMTTLEQQAPYKLVASLAFDGGEANSRCGFYLNYDGSKTTLTWDFHSKASGAMERYFGLFIEKFLGAYYEKGLAQLKVVAEDRAKAMQLQEP